MKALPGRKTDISDAQWIADLLQHRQQRELLELTRYRKNRMEERTREINRLQKILEGANIKLSGAVTDIMGLSARNLLSMVTSNQPITLKRVETCMKDHLKASADELLLSVDAVDTLPGIARPVPSRLLRKPAQI